MSYQKALEAAGAVVHRFEEFGSYQGDWWALVTHGDKTGWVNGSYGSCSGCDAFEAEFGWDDEEKSDYTNRLAGFGRGYLDKIMSKDEAIKLASRDIVWDCEAEAVVSFLKAA